MVNEQVSNTVNRLVEVKMRILIIEDEIDLADALARGLRQIGYAIDIAVNGMAGWDLGQVNDYDLLILDLNLPELDGLEVCQRLRAVKPNLLILILTARSELDDKIMGLDMGADDYLIKPFHFEELAARIRALLRRDLRVRDPVLSVWLGRESGNWNSPKKSLPFWNC
jgi:DNA-binding response OmpR family regulator